MRSSCSNSSCRHPVLVYFNFRPSLSLFLSLSLAENYVFLGGRNCNSCPQCVYAIFELPPTLRMRNLAQKQQNMNPSVSNKFLSILTLIRRRHKFHFYTPIQPNHTTDPSFSTKVTYDFLFSGLTFLPALHFNPKKICGGT